jgi:hypothetical protein
VDLSGHQARVAGLERAQHSASRRDEIASNRSENLRLSLNRYIKGRELEGPET